MSKLEHKWERIDLFPKNKKRIKMRCSGCGLGGIREPGFDVFPDKGVPGYCGGVIEEPKEPKAPEPKGTFTFKFK